MTDAEIRRLTILVACDLAADAYATLEVRTAVLENLFGNPDTTIEQLRVARERQEDAYARFRTWVDAVEFGCREMTGHLFLGADI